MRNKKPETKIQRPDKQVGLINPTTDTHPDAENIQISLIRKAGIARRIALACSLSQTVIKLSRRAISRANPRLSERELNLAFVAYNYGSGIADRLRNYLERKNSCVILS